MLGARLSREGDNGRHVREEREERLPRERGLFGCRRRERVSVDTTDAQVSGVEQGAQAGDDANSSLGRTLQKLWGEGRDAAQAGCQRRALCKRDAARRLLSEVI